jgi:hypothetical protein
MGEWMYIFLTSALVGGDFTPLAALLPDLRAGLDDMEKRKFLTPPGLELRPVGRPARSDYAIPTPHMNITT